MITKGISWTISDLLQGSPYHNDFNSGIFAHSFLDVHDYHHFHAPVAGQIKEVRNISSRVYLDVQRNDEGELDVINGDNYQVNQERGLIIIESFVLGLVALIAVGMAVVSSVNLTKQQGQYVQKGEELGYFLFGGSDVILLFQNKGVKIEIPRSNKPFQGERIAIR